jgi:hypothetical protein
MNTQIHPLLDTISDIPSKKEATIVHEQPQSGPTVKKTFSAAELWNIQRQRKIMMQRRQTL